MSNQYRVEPNIGWSKLSPLERDVALLVAEGLSNGQIAARLGRTPASVSAKVDILYMKSGVTPPDGAAGRRRRGDREKLIAWACTLPGAAPPDQPVQ